MRSPARHKTTIDARKATPVGAVSGSGHDGHDLGDRRRISRIALALVAWKRPAWTPGIVAGERRRPAASSTTCDMHASFLIAADATPRDRTTEDVKAAARVHRGRLRTARLPGA